MTSLTLPISDEFKNSLKVFMWINWSEIAREEAIKKLIFESYMRTGDITDRQWEFCEKIDWHPVDELPLKEEFIKKLDKIKKEKGIKFKNIDELRRIIENKMYAYEIMPPLQRILNKLSKKDKNLYEIIMNKIEEIIENPYHYKPLKYDLAGERRVHIMKSFVLKFGIDEQKKIVRFIFFGHHDEAFRR